MELGKIQGLKDDEVRSLGNHWITSAEQFISLYYNLNKKENLMQLIGVEENRLKEIAKLISDSLPSEVLSKLKNYKGPDRPTGAKKPK